VKKSFNKTIIKTYYVPLRHVCATIVAVKKAISVSYSVCRFVALDIQHEMRMRHNVICGPYNSTIFFSHYLMKGMTVENTLSKINVCFDLF
jgi:hypothetical protein